MSPNNFRLKAILSVALNVVLITSYSLLLTALAIQQNWAWSQWHFLVRREPLWMLHQIPWVAYVPFWLVVGWLLAHVTVFLIRIVLTDESRKRIADDPLYELEHNGVDSPPMNHLSHVLWTCAGSDGGLWADLQQFHISPIIPAAKLVSMKSAPSKEQVESIPQ